jgi:hypothetical protein
MLDLASYVRPGPDLPAGPGRGGGGIPARGARVDDCHLHGQDRDPDESRDDREARIMTQAGIVVSQFFNSLTVRSEDQSILAIGEFTNRRLLLADEGRKAIVRRRRPRALRSSACGPVQFPARLTPEPVRKGR